MKRELPKGISRIDQEIKRTHGFYCRLSFKGKQHAKFFSDLKCGGRNQALLNAIAWLRNTHKRLNKIDTPRRQFMVPRTSTGVVGVGYDSRMDRYIVTWHTPNGKAQKTSVSCRKHGDRQAFVKACAIRNEKEVIRLTA